MAALEATSSLGSINWCSHVHMSVALPAKTLQERKSTLFKMPSREAHNPPLRHSWSPEVTSLGHQVKQTQFPVLGVSSMTIPPLLFHQKCIGFGLQKYKGIPICGGVAVGQECRWSDALVNTCRAGREDLWIWLPLAPQCASVTRCPVLPEF